MALFHLLKRALDELVHRRLRIYWRLKALKSETPISVLYRDTKTCQGFLQICSLLPLIYF